MSALPEIQPAAAPTLALVLRTDSAASIPETAQNRAGLVVLPEAIRAKYPISALTTVLHYGDVFMQAGEWLRCIGRDGAEVVAVAFLHPAHPLRYLTADGAQSWSRVVYTLSSLYTVYRQPMPSAVALAAARERAYRWFAETDEPDDGGFNIDEWRRDNYEAVYGRRW